MAETRQHSLVGLNLPGSVPTNSHDSRPEPATAHDAIQFPNLIIDLGLPLTTSSTCITLRLCGEPFTYNLKSLGSDPQEIIQLLRLTTSERGNWILVGAYYRRNGNAQAAIRVMTAMLDEMAKHNVPEGRLKPVFLFLSSCEMDLKVQGGKAKEALHLKKAQHWLQKVHDTLTHTALSKPEAPPPQPHNSHYKILEREIDSLRDRYAVASEMLAEVRSRKRKLEDEVTWERESRRRLEREIDDLRHNLDRARRMETYALDEMRRETAIRQEAEAVLQRERCLRRDATQTWDV